MGALHSVHLFFKRINQKFDPEHLGRQNCLDGRKLLWVCIFLCNLLGYFKHEIKTLKYFRVIFAVRGREVTTYKCTEMLLVWKINQYPSASLPLWKVLLLQAKNTTNIFPDMTQWKWLFNITYTCPHPLKLVNIYRYGIYFLFISLFLAKVEYITNKLQKVFLQPKWTYKQIQQF